MIYIINSHWDFNVIDRSTNPLQLTELQKVGLEHLIQRNKQKMINYREPTAYLAQNRIPPSRVILSTCSVAGRYLVDYARRNFIRATYLMLKTWKYIEVIGKSGLLRIRLDLNYLRVREFGWRVNFLADQGEKVYFFWANNFKPSVSNMIR